MKTLILPPASFRDTAAAGCYAISTQSLPACIEAADAAACHVTRIDLHGARDKTELLTRIARALDFPQWFGHNWDALGDCLGDLDWLPEATAHVLCLTGIVRGHPDTETLLEVLGDAAEAWRERGTAMWVLVATEPPRA